jgi:hypothetical protein
MLNLIKRLAFSVAVASLVGCAATVTQTPTSASSPATAPRAQPPAGAFVAVVTGGPAVRANGDWQSFLEEWQASLAAAAATAKMPFVFAQDETAIPSNASILVRLTVNDFKYVSTTKRFMLGVMAGNAYMDVDAQYVELPANKLFGSKKFNTSSSAWEGIFSAVTPKQVQTVSEKIVNEVVSTTPTK